MRNSKKGQAGILTAIILLIVGVVAGVMFASNDDGSGLTIEEQQASGTGDATSKELTFTEDVTVTFSSSDMFSKGTDAGTAHRILEIDGTIDTVVSDDATLEKSPGNSYTVLIGNKTDASDITAGTDYYPVLVSGTLPDDGTFTVRKNQPLTGGASQLTYTFFDENGDSNTAQAIASDDERTMEIKIRANNNLCIGNPDTGQMNALTYQYNKTLFDSVTQLDANGNDQSTIGTPDSISAVVGKSERTYEFPVVCDNKEVRRGVRLDTASTEPDGSDDNINITLSDTSWYVDDDTLEPKAGYEDEDSNDLGVTDFVVGSLKFT